MLQTFCTLHHKKPHFEQVSSVLSQICIFSRKKNFAAEASLRNPQINQSLETNQLRKNASPINFSGITERVIAKCSHLWDTNKGETFNNLSLQDYILRLSYKSPEKVRKFWRVSALEPKHVLEILLGFESDTSKWDIDVRLVESLWGIFKWASKQSCEFEHYPYSCKIMASMLVQVGSFRDVEYLLSRKDSQGILLDCQEIFSNLIEGYAGQFELDSAVSIYDKMRGLSLVPSVSSYHALLECLTELNETQSMYRVYVDMLSIEMGDGMEHKQIRDNVVKLLCLEGKVQEARDLVKKVKDLGIEPSNVVISAISQGYCKKKDYDDLLSFIGEVRIAPDCIVGNKILFSICRNFGVKRASLCMQELENLGFHPDETTFGILIGFSCREGKLKDAFMYLSDILSRHLKPHVYSYNAILSGLFKEGLWMHARDVLVEMDDVGVKPTFSTFKLLIAGFCRARQFDEVKDVLRQMADLGLAKLLSLEDPLAKAFKLLGLDPLAVKVKRDNDEGLSKTEFFDSIGNGLYLDTDLDEYEKRISHLLDEAMMPDCNSSTVMECQSPDSRSVLKMVNEMERWGQEMSLPALSSLLSHLSRAPFSIKTINYILDFSFTSAHQLDQSTLNMLVQAYSRNGLTFKARTLFDVIIRRGYEIEDAAYSALLLNLCRKGDLRSFHYCFKLAEKFTLLPEENDVKDILVILCRNKWLNEVMELLQTILIASPCNISDALQSLVEELCQQGYSSTAGVLVEEFSNQTAVLDSMAYHHLFYGYCQEKRVVEAITVFDTMLSENIHPPLDVTIQILNLLCRTHQFEKAVALKDVFLNEKPSARRSANCALVKGYCRSGRVQEAASLFMEILSNDLIPDMEVFDELIQSFCRAKNFKKVFELLGFMMRKNLSILITSYSNMVCSMCKEGRFFPAMNLKELVVCAANLPELVLYNILIFYLRSTFNSSLLNAAIDGFKKKRLEFNDVTFNYVIQGFLSCKDVLLSLEYLTDMMRLDIKPSNRSLREVITCLCYNGKLEAALKLSREMELRGWIHTSVTFNTIAEALLTNGKLHEAVDFVDRMESKGLFPNNIECDYLIKQFYRHGRMDKAVDLLNIMLRKGSVPQSASYDYLIQGHCNCNKFDLALDFHAEMLYRDLKPGIVTWETLVFSSINKGRVTEAEKLMNTMIHRGETPCREMFCSVINKYRSEKNFSKASELVKVMQQLGYNPDFDTHWSLISNLSNSSKRIDSNENRSFVSSLLSDFGFSRRNPRSRVQ